MKKISLLFFILLSLFVSAQSEKLPGLTANISGLTKGAITVKQILDAKEIVVSDAELLVISYRLSAYGKGRDALVRQVNSNTIPMELKDAIAKFILNTLRQRTHMVINLWYLRWGLS